MAGGLQNRHGGGRRNAYRPMAEINVTPMVDVMLVLLIVFMVAAPLLTVGVPVDLPQTNAPSLTEPKEPIAISIKQDGSIFIQDTAIEADSLVAKLQAVSKNNLDAVVFVRGDKGVNYGRVMEVMGLLSSAGFTKATLIAELPATGRK